MFNITEYTIKDIASAVNGSANFYNEDAVICDLVIDSRTLVKPDTALFFAIKAHRDGHQFINEAYANGIRNFVVANSFDFSLYCEANFVLVPDTLVALQTLATKHRSGFDLEVIGITGSNGKTIVKEWLYQLLSADHHIVRSPKSYNSQIGVPLSIWQITSRHNLGIFEAGISTVNEMIKLTDIIQPTIGILTNIKEAHDAGFEDKAQKLKEKLKLFTNVNTLVYCVDDLPNDIVLTAKRTFSWSFNQQADLKIERLETDKDSTKLTATYKKDRIDCVIPFSDQASIENVATCWATLLAIGYEEEEAAYRLSNLVKVGMRLQLINGINQCSLIDDSYSADISSLSITLDFLNKQNQHAKRTVVLSDLQETGKSDEELYKEIALLLKQKKVDRLIGVGKLEDFSQFFDLQKQFFATTEQLISELNSLDFQDETILIKGARKFEFEKVVKRLAEKVHDTVLEINLNALVANLQFYRSKLPKEVKTMAMVKAFSYGSGSFEVANLLQYHKVDYLAVAFADEGIALREAGIKLPIMVMSPTVSAFDAMIRYNLEPEIYSVDLLRAFIRSLPATGHDFSIHVKLDTGMHRLGFEAHQIEALKQELKLNKSLRVASVFTHLVGADEEVHDEFTQHQISLFQQMYQDLTTDLKDKPLRHVLNTSGISRWSSYHFDMVRVGIGLYGYDGALSNGVAGLQTVVTLKTTISQLKEIPAGDTVGYSRRGQMPNGGTIATVKIGYADGYSRAFGNGVGKMLVAGKLVPTIGSICMDMCMLDVTGLNLSVGDEVIVFNQELSIATLADAVQTIPYEILTNVSQRVKRIYTYE